MHIRVGDILSILMLLAVFGLCAKAADWFGTW